MYTLRVRTRFIPIFPLSRNVCSKKVVHLSNAYDPHSVENGWYDWWETQGFFRPEFQKEEENCKDRFCIVLPPPNVTGSLHLGHTLTNSIQDAIIRWYRMNGKRVLWLPGFDHAGIATQVVCEKLLWKEQKKTRHDLEKKEFLEYIWKWKNKKEKEITQQLRRLGLSLDWTKSVFTMDPQMAKAVTEAFVRLHDEGLIVRKNQMVNWCCHLRSTISDVEVEHLELAGRENISVPGYSDPVEVGVLYYIAYKLTYNPDDEIIIATTRPETMFGDVAIAVHPDDKRYKNLCGRTAKNPLTGNDLDIIADLTVESKFGTGAVKVTPAHDTDDYERAKKFNLKYIDIMDDNGIMNELCGDFKGLPRFQARKAIVNYLKEKGVLRNEVSHRMNLPICSRSGDIVESKLKPQWFIDAGKMAQDAIQAVESGNLQIIPEDHVKRWIHWLKSTKYWCISRQLVWGHQIPAYKVTTKDPNIQEMWISGRSREEAMEKASNKLGINQCEITLDRDQDVLDTWFSSSLFPFASLGWPENTKLLKTFYPISLMETGHDILPFWVTRMVMLGLKLTGQLPFNKILLHGILCDAHGKKMSKSRGNYVDPNDVINGATLEKLHEQSKELLKMGILTGKELQNAISGQKKNFPQGIPVCSADALRFALCNNDFKAHFINFDVRYAYRSRQFCNKILQATRFVFQAIETVNDPLVLEITDIQNDLSIIDKWILSCLATAIEESNSAFIHYNLHCATRAMHTFFYSEFCDVYLEAVKPVLKSGIRAEIPVTVLLTCLHTSLLMFSPFMPFLTEELYQILPVRNKAVSITVARYPKTEQWLRWKNIDLQNDVNVILEALHTARNIKQTLRLKEMPLVFIRCTDHKLRATMLQMDDALKSLLNVATVSVETENWQPEENQISQAINSSVSIHITSQDSKMDKKKQISNLNASAKAVRSKLDKLVRQTSSKKNVPIQIQEKDAAKKLELETKLAEINNNIDILQKLLES